MMGNENTNIIISAERWGNALYKAYEYCGGSVSNPTFKQAVYDNNMASSCAMDLFEKLTGDTILYFGVVSSAIKSELTEI